MIVRYCKRIDWSNNNDLPLNINKCSSISFTRNHNILTFNYSISNTTLNRVTSIKDLGILLDSQLTFENHIIQIVSRANKLLGFVIRNSRQFTNDKSVKLLYFSLVRPILEYGSVVWNPVFQKYKILIEKVQKKFIKYAFYKFVHIKWNYRYHTKLVYFNIRTLESRRNIYDLIWLYKCLNNHIDNSKIFENISIRVPSFNSRNIDLFSYPRSNSIYHAASPYIRVAKLFNDTCTELDIFALSLNTFKFHVSAIIT
jgi:hypothetical protein